MRRALLVVWYACQACLGLAVLGLAAVSASASDVRTAVLARAPARTQSPPPTPASPPTASARSHGPAIP